MSDETISTRDDKITSFICGDYCQFCDNNKCNVQDIMEKYQSNYLTFIQMREASEFQLEKISCKNHIPNEGFLMFGHIIEIHFIDGSIEKRDGFYSAKIISEMWNDDVDFIDILFTDV